MHLGHIADGPTPNHLDCLPQAIFAGALIAHLGDNAHLFGRLPHQPGLLD